MKFYAGCIQKVKWNSDWTSNIVMIVCFTFYFPNKRIAVGGWIGVDKTEEKVNSQKAKIKMRKLVRFYKNNSEDLNHQILKACLKCHSSVRISQWVSLFSIFSSQKNHFHNNQNNKIYGRKFFVKFRVHCRISV